MSKMTLGQRKLSTLGQRSTLPKSYVGPTLSCYLGKAFTSFAKLPNKLRRLLNTPLDNTRLTSAFHYSTINWTALAHSITSLPHSYSLFFIAYHATS